MPVYVDNQKNPFGRMLMSHMIADTPEELFAMARKLGLKREWLQKYGEKNMHYDVCQSKRKLAIGYGAIEVDARELIRIIRSNSYVK